MSAETGRTIKHGIWGALLGAVITIVVGFAWGGWATRGGSQGMAADAVLTTRAAICVAQFMGQSNTPTKLKELKDIGTWERASFVEKGGWDKMPGEARADYSVSRACADGLGRLADK